jgi:hypothetical protein
MGDLHEITELITPGPAEALAGLLGAQAGPLRADRITAVGVLRG